MWKYLKDIPKVFRATPQPVASCRNTSNSPSLQEDERSEDLLWKDTSSLNKEEGIGCGDETLTPDHSTPSPRPNLFHPFLGEVEVSSSVAVPLGTEWTKEAAATLHSSGSSLLKRVAPLSLPEDPPPAVDDKYKEETEDDHRPLTMGEETLAWAMHGEAVVMMNKGRYYRAVQLLTTPARMGYGESNYLLGTLHASGKGADADQARAAKYYELAMKSSHARGTYMLALHKYSLVRSEAAGAHPGDLAKGSLDGKLEEIKHLMKAAARKGVSEAHHWLGLTCLQKKDYGPAVSYLTKGAQLQNAECHYLLGLCVEQNMEAALAQLPHTVSPTTQAKHHFSAVVKLSRNRGISGARHNSPVLRDALYKLGRYAEKGLGGMEVDEREALSYYGQAARGGHKEAVDAWRRLDAQIFYEKLITDDTANLERRFIEMQRIMTDWSSTSSTNTVGYDTFMEWIAEADLESAHLREERKKRRETTKADNSSASLANGAHDREGSSAVDFFEESSRDSSGDSIDFMQSVSGMSSDNCVTQDMGLKPAGVLSPKDVSSERSNDGKKGRRIRAHINRTGKPTSNGTEPDKLSELPSSKSTRLMSSQTSLQGSVSSSSLLRNKSNLTDLISCDNPASSADLVSSAGFSSSTDFMSSADLASSAGAPSPGGLNYSLTNSVNGLPGTLSVRIDKGNVLPAPMKGPLSNINNNNNSSLKSEVSRGSDNYITPEGLSSWLKDTDSAPTAISSAITEGIPSTHSAANEIHTGATLPMEAQSQGVDEHIVAKAPQKSHEENTIQVVGRSGEEFVSKFFGCSSASSSDEEMSDAPDGSGWGDELSGRRSPVSWENGFDDDEDDDDAFIRPNIGPLRLGL